MDYQDQLAIGNIFNLTIDRVLKESGGTGDLSSLVSAIAQAILVTLDQAGYKIEKK